MENMKLCPICHEEVFDNEEIKIQGVPYHEWCYGEEYLDEISGMSGGSAVGYSSGAFTLNYPEKDDDYDEKEVSDTKKKKEDIDEEILKKIDEMSSTASIVGYQNPLGTKTGNKTIKDPYKKDRKGKKPRIDSDSKIRNDLAVSDGYIKEHPLSKLSDILKK